MDVQRKGRGGKPKRRWMDSDNVKYDLRFEGLGIVRKDASAAADDDDDDHTKGLCKVKKIPKI